MTRRRRRRQRGFTLVELLVTLALSMVGLLGGLMMQLMAMRGNAASRNFVEAVGLVQERLETAQSVSYASLAQLATTETNLAPNPGATTQRLYTRLTTVAAAGGSTTISVTVSWADGTQAARTHRVTMYEVRSP